jgi:hypothetical protein
MIVLLLSMINLHKFVLSNSELPDSFELMFFWLIIMLILDSAKVYDLIIFDGWDLETIFKLDP